MDADFARKLRQIILNDQSMGRRIRLASLERRTGHNRDEIKAAVKKLKTIPRSKGGLGL